MKRRSRKEDIWRELLIVFIIISLVFVGIDSALNVTDETSASEFTSSGGYLGTNDSGAHWGPEICLTDSTSNSTQPSIAIDNSGRLHLLWLDDAMYNSSGRLAYYRSSDNGGTNWSVAHPISPEYPDDSFCYIHYNSFTDSIVVYRHNVVRDGAYVSYSYDHGLTWTRTFPVGISYLPLSTTKDLAASTGNYSFFSDWEYHYSSWYGVSLEGPVLHSTLYANSQFNGTGDDFYFDGEDVASIAAGNGKIYAAIPISDGLNFSIVNPQTGRYTTPVRITNLTATTTALSADGDSLYLVWSSTVNGSTQLYFKTSHDAGLTWSDDMKITDSAGTADHPDISIEQGKVNIVWQDHASGRWQVHFMQVDSAGNVLINDTQLSNSTGDAMYPQIVTDSNGYSYVVWQDSRNGKWDVYMRRNPDKDITPPKITHQPVETIGGMQNLTINATVTDNFGVQDVSVRYWGDRTASSLTKDMALTSGDMKNGTWEAKILPSELHSRNIYYYIQAADSDNIAVTSIYHVVVTGCPPHFDAVGNYSVTITGDREINISITDTFGVDAAVLYYSVNRSEYAALNMSLSAGYSVTGIWSSVIQGLPAGSNISFYVEAVSGDTTNSTEVFSFATEKNEVNSDLTPPSDDSNTSMAGSPVESDGLAGVFYSNLLPIIAGIMALLILIGAVVYRRRCRGRNDIKERGK